MIPSPAQLAAISELDQGDLAQAPFPVLLHLLAQAERTVVLEIERKPLKKQIIFENGVPVDCRSNLLHETLSRFMVLRGELSDEDSRALMAKAASNGVQFGEMMILEGRITASDLYRTLQQNLAKKLLDGFTWRSGNFRIVDEVPVVESPLKVKVPQLVVTGISKFASQEEVNEAVGQLVGKSMTLHPAAPYSLRDIRLPGPLRQVTTLLEHGKRIDELAAETSVPFDEITRLLYGLAVLGIAWPEEWIPKDVTAPAMAPVTKPVDLEAASAAFESVDPEEAEQRRNELMEAYLKHRKQDSFDLLGLEDDADAITIEKKYLEFCQKFAPWRFEAVQLLDLVEKAEDLFLAAGRAFGELSDGERRSALLARRHTLRQQKKHRPDPNRFAIKSDLLDSEHQFKKGKALMEKGNYRDALQNLQFAHDCDPQNPIYRSELAYCDYLLSPETQADQAIASLQQTLRIDPKCGLACYYAGLILGDVGNRPEAEKILRRAIKLMTPDRRPIEALKSLTTKKARR